MEKDNGKIYNYWLLMRNSGLIISWFDLPLSRISNSNCSNPTFNLTNDEQTIPEKRARLIQWNRSIFIFIFFGCKLYLQRIAKHEKSSKSSKEYLKDKFMFSSNLPLSDANPVSFMISANLKQDWLQKLKNDNGKIYNHWLLTRSAGLIMIWSSVFSNT